MISLVYIVIGLLFFCYLLISELKYYPYEDMRTILPPRKAGYYSNHIYNIIIAFNVTSVVARIIGAGLVLLFRYTIKKIEALSK